MPGAVLRTDFMNPYGLTINKLALELRVPAKRISEIVRQRLPIRAEPARLL